MLPDIQAPDAGEPDAEMPDASLPDDSLPDDSLPDDNLIEPEAPQDTCALEHRAFHTLTDVLFRRAEGDETPVIVMSLGERAAAVPLRALQRELGIGDDTADGRMLDLIARSLDYVAGLHLGDPLPAEVLDGRASWAPGATHRAVAAARLRLQLTAWLRPEAAGVVLPDAGSVRRLDEDPSMRQHVSAAMEQAALDLGLAGSDDVVRLLETLAEELSYIEALREGLLNRSRRMLARIERFTRACRVNSKRVEMLAQVRRLGTIAVDQLGARFADIDAHSQEVMTALRNLDGERSLIRSSRDWLYRLSRAWEPLLQAWDDSAGLPDDALWHLIERTYGFLAPRHMRVQEWQDYVGGMRRGRPKPMGTAMTW